MRINVNIMGLIFLLIIVQPYINRSQQAIFNIPMAVVAIALAGRRGIIMVVRIIGTLAVSSGQYRGDTVAMMVKCNRMRQYDYIGKQYK